MFAVGMVYSTDIFRVDEVPALPAKVLASDYRHVVDGMAVSAACAFARLGGSAKICARVGDDGLGEVIRDDLAAEGMDVSGVHTIPGSVSSRVTVIVDCRGDRLVVPYLDPHLDTSPDWLPLDEIADAGIVHCDVRWVDGSEAALLAARKAGVPGMVDGDVAPLAALQRLVPLASHAVFSDAGLLIYARDNDVEAALVAVGKDHQGHVGASCGADGYAWYEDGHVHRVPAPRVDVVDTLAAGDVFHGAFALALLEGKDIRAAARFACVAASLKCTRFGGRLGCPTRDEIDRLVAKTYAGS